MDTERMIAEIKDLIIKAINTENAMENGRWLHAHRKVLGIHQKLQWLQAVLVEEIENPKPSVEEIENEVAETPSTITFRENPVKEAKESGKMIKYGREERRTSPEVGELVIN